MGRETFRFFCQLRFSATNRPVPSLSGGNARFLESAPMAFPTLPLVDDGHSTHVKK